MRWRDNGLSAVLVMSVAVLPLAFLPTRIEAHETYRAGLLALLAVCAVPPIVWRPSSKSQAIFLLVLGFWCASLILASIFSLSPTRSFAGDFFRRMGLWTELLLVMGVFIASRFHFRSVWRWFWLAALLVSAHAILEALILDTGMRPKGLLGWSTFTAGWLALAGLWSLLGLWSEYGDLSRIERSVYGLGIIVFFLAMFALGARGAALGMAGGLVTAGLTWITWHGQRKWIVGFIAAGLLLSVLCVILSRLDWRGNQNLFVRLEYGFSDPFRDQTWTHVLSVTQQWPVLFSAYGEIDRWGILRPVFGYGLEMYAPPSSTIDLPLILDLGQTPIDRAHNDWFDTLISMGWFGVLARLALWLAAGWLALSRLGFRSFRMGLLVFVGGLLGIVVTWGAPYIALAATIGGLAGFWIGLLVTDRLSLVSNTFDLQAWLAIAVLTAHILELQFGFDTVATSWPAWLALGLLLSPPAQSEIVLIKTPTWAWTAVAGAFLIRGLAASPGYWLLLLLLIIGLSAAHFISPFPQFAWWWIIGCWAVGGLLSLQWPPEVASLGSILMLVAGLFLCSSEGRQILLPPLTVKKSMLWLLPIIPVIWWWFDLTADHYFWLGHTARRQGDIVTGANTVETGLRFRPWDDRMALEVGRLRLEIAEHLPGTEVVDRALVPLETAVCLNPFDVNYVLQLAEVYAQRAIASDVDQSAYWQRADHYFAAAAQLQPHSGMIWRRWARYTLNIMDDPIKAYALASKAVEIDPNNEFTQRLMGQIESRLSQER